MTKAERITRKPIAGKLCCALTLCRAKTLHDNTYRSQEPIIVSQITVSQRDVVLHNGSYDNEKIFPKMWRSSWC
jgi:hypothetical protein